MNYADVIVQRVVHRLWRMFESLDRRDEVHVLEAVPWWLRAAIFALLGMGDLERIAGRVGAGKAAIKASSFRILNAEVKCSR